MPNLFSGFDRSCNLKAEQADESILSWAGLYDVSGAMNLCE